MNPEATARLIALPDALRAWAREEPVVRACLARHVLDGLPLGTVLAAVDHALDVREELYARLTAAEPPGALPPDWCAATLPGGYRCRALGRIVVLGGAGLCEDCARAWEGAGPPPRCARSGGRKRVSRPRSNGRGTEIGTAPKAGAKGAGW